MKSDSENSEKEMSVSDFLRNINNLESGRYTITANRKDTDECIYESIKDIKENIQYLTDVVHRLENGINNLQSLCYSLVDIYDELKLLNEKMGEK